jgi:hypothetical protein
MREAARLPRDVVRLHAWSRLYARCVRQNGVTVTTINAALSGLTREQYAQWSTNPEGWDRWACGLVMGPNGPMVLVLGVTGSAGVRIMNGAATIHAHDSAEEALVCWESFASDLVDMALMMDPRSHVPGGQAVTDAPLALPVSSDEPTARGFGWL